MVCRIELECKFLSHASNRIIVESHGRPRTFDHHRKVRILEGNPKKS